MRAIRQSFLVIATLLCFELHGATTVVVQTDKPGAHINPAMWGVFFEDINFGADGGLYAELIKNRSFEFPQVLMGWSVPAEKADATLAVVKDAPDGSAADKHFLRLESKDSYAVIENEGFRGIGTIAGDSYDFSVKVRNLASAGMRIELVGP